MLQLSGLHFHKISPLTRCMKCAFLKCFFFVMYKLGNSIGVIWTGKEAGEYYILVARVVVAFLLSHCNLQLFLRRLDLKLQAVNWSSPWRWSGENLNRFKKTRQHIFCNSILCISTPEEIAKIVHRMTHITRLKCN